MDVIRTRTVGEPGGRPGAGTVLDRVSIGALTRTFPPEPVDRIVAMTDTLLDLPRLGA